MPALRASWGSGGNGPIVSASTLCPSPCSSDGQLSGRCRCRAVRSPSGCSRGSRAKTCSRSGRRQAQGSTVQAAFVLAEETLTREHAYAALSRGAEHNALYIASPPDVRVEERHVPEHETHPVERARAALRRSTAKTMAIDAGPCGLADLQEERARLRATIGPQPRDPTHALNDTISCLQRAGAKLEPTRVHRQGLEERLDATRGLRRFTHRDERVELDAALHQARASEGSHTVGSPTSKTSETSYPTRETATPHGGTRTSRNSISSTESKPRSVPRNDPDTSTSTEPAPPSLRSTPAPACSATLQRRATFSPDRITTTCSWERKGLALLLSGRVARRACSIRRSSVDGTRSARRYYDERSSSEGRVISAGGTRR